MKTIKIRPNNPNLYHDGIRLFILLFIFTMCIAVKTYDEREHLLAGIINNKEATKR